MKIMKSPPKDLPYQGLSNNTMNEYHECTQILIIIIIILTFFRKYYFNNTPHLSRVFQWYLTHGWGHFSLGDFHVTNKIKNQPS